MIDPGADAVAVAAGEWDEFEGWCDRRGVDPFDPSVVAEFEAESDSYQVWAALDAREAAS